MPKVKTLIRLKKGYLEGGVEMLLSLNTPLSDAEILNLKAGDQVELNGIIYTARDAAHSRLIRLIEEGRDLPFDLSGQIIYYVGPTPAKPGRVIGSAGPTTSYRMDKYTPQLLKMGLKGIIGKGKRSPKVKELFSQYQAVYLVAIGGAGALLSSHIKSAEIIAYPDLGPEAIYKLEVKSFPVIVCYDAKGGDLYEEGRSRFRKNFF